MPDAVQTIRELVTGFNQIQQQMGLTPLSANMAGFTPPQTPAGMPQMGPKPPGDIAAEMAAQMNQQVQVAQRTFQAQSQFAQEFGQRMQSIKAQYVSPQAAQYMARTSGAPEFGLGGPLGDFPSPVYQTSPEMGVYRPGMPRPGMAQPAGVPGAGFNAPMPAPFIPQPYMPLWPGGPYLGNMMPQAFGGEAPMGRFGDPWQRGQMQQEYMGNRAFAQAMAVTPTIATTLPGAGLGATGGAMLGARMGGARGALIGGGLGFLGGGIAGQPLFEELGFGRAGEALVDPAVRTRAFGNQLEAISRQFVTSGPDLHPLGRGLAQRPAIALANQMQGMVEKGEMGEFNMRDMMRITGMAAQGGMLDMAQSGTQIASQVRNVARALQNFMQIAEEPDVQRAMQMMSNMRAFGLSIPETQIAARNAQQFARMAGTTTQGLMATAGAQGAMVFQQQGLTGGTGMEAGMGAAGLARAAIAGGAFTPAQLALAGGQQGLTQTLTEASAANLNVRFPMMAALSRNEQGELFVDPQRLERIMSGKADLTRQIEMADANVDRLARAGGVPPERVISEITSRTRELQDEMGRRLGPLGMHQMVIRQALNIQQELGGSIDLASALRMAGVRDPNQAQSIARLAQSPETWRNAQQSVLADIPRLRQQEAARREDLIEQGGWRAGMRAGVIGDVGRAFTGAGEGISRGWRHLREDVASWWTGGMEETAGGGRRVHIPDRLRITDNETARAFARRRSEEEAAGIQTQDPLAGLNAPRLMSADDRLTDAQRRSQSYDTALTLSMFLPLGGATWAARGARAAGMGVATSLLPEATEIKQSSIVRAGIAEGGVGGFFAAHTPGLYSQFYDPTSAMPDMETKYGTMHQDPLHEWRTQLRREKLQRGASIMAAGRTATAGIAESAEVRRAGERQLDESYAQVFGEGGVEERTRLQRQLFEGMRTFMDKPEWFKKTPTTEQMQEAAIEEAVKQQGEGQRAKITEFVKKNWATDPALGSQALGRQLLAQVTTEGGTVSKGLVAAQQKEAGIDQGIMGANTLKEAVKRAKAETETARAWMGGNALIGGMSDEGQQAYEAQMVQRGGYTKTKSGKEISPIIRQQLDLAKTLRQSQNPADAEKADTLEKEAKAKLEALGIAPTEIETLIKSSRAFTGAAREAAIIHGKYLTGSTMDTASREANIGAMVGYVDKEGKKQAGLAGRAVERLNLLRGALDEAEATGRTKEEILKEASTDSRLRERLHERGRSLGPTSELGGGGVGGAGEKAARVQAEQLEKTGLDVAKFNQATVNLLKVSENFANAVKARGLVGAAGQGNIRPQG